MPSDHDSYDVFLETWQPSRHLEHACLPSYIDDLGAQERLMQDIEAVGDVPRMKKHAAGYNGMQDDEAHLRRLAFLQEHQHDWAADFGERMISYGVRAERLETFIDGMANTWTRGFADRQQSPLMRSVKSSIQAHDRLLHQGTAGKFVIDDSDFGFEPLFDPKETAYLFLTNSEMLQYAIPDYLEALYGDQSGATDKLYARRGICMPHEPEADRKEASYLSSFSLAIGPTELFAQTMGRRICTQIPCIVSCPIAALHDRVVAFAPFIKGMTLDQMEIVVAPPIRATPLHLHGKFGDIREYTFM